MSKLETFLVLFPVGHLNTILIPATNKVLNDPLDHGEFTRWVGYWLYMDYWIGISITCDWWSVPPPVIHIGAPFWLNQ